MAVTPNERMLEREFRAADRDLVIAETDLADDETDIGFPESGIVGLKLFAEHVPEAIDDFGRNAALTLFHLPLEALDRIIQRGHFGAMLSETLGDGGIAGRHETGLDQLQELADCGFRPSSFGACLLEIACTTLIGYVRSFEDVDQQLAEAGGFENPVFELVQHEFVELLFTNALARATARRPIRLGVAGIVAVSATLAGRDRQSMVAAGHIAHGDAGQQRAPVGDAWRGLCRRGLGAGRGDDFGFLGLDDARTFDPDPVLGSGNATVIVGCLVRVGAAIVWPFQNPVDRAVEEGLAAQRIAVGFEPFGDRPGPHRLAG
ncbi:MAG: hypothetical protein A3E77_14440 [Sphingopyxis sp. RIFCSPHIGHO2_12_FULL_65_19]|nr:hypothetical protein [Sphingopyxis sp. RIFCSPHIGHO2_12_FULL_65_19]OHD07903.1 MAG: hypothetical protein A3E77_14440 [Sphingopyxis sp. RIFCSPHIGHO2_12_FULL_65_19]